MHKLRGTAKALKEECEVIVAFLYIVKYALFRIVVPYFWIYACLPATIFLFNALKISFLGNIFFIYIKIVVYSITEISIILQHLTLSSMFREKLEKNFSENFLKEL